MVKRSCQLKIHFDSSSQRIFEELTINKISDGCHVIVCGEQKNMKPVTFSEALRFAELY